MNIAIIHSVSGLSAKFLAEYLDNDGHTVSIYKPHDSGKRDFTRFDKVISIGCSAKIDAQKGAIINRSDAVKRCVDKRITFKTLNLANVNTLEWVDAFDRIPDTWDQVAVRMSASGRKAEDLLWFLNPSEKADMPKYAELYTRCFYGKYEYRVVVVCGKIVGRYYKSHDLTTGNWDMKLQRAEGFEVMDNHILRSAKALGIDYAGFDIIAKNKKEFAILEANSGATILAEAAEAFVQLLRN